MAKRELPDQALLLKLLRYEPETGKLYWRKRDISMFNRPGRGGPASAMGRWNKLYADKEAFTADHGNGYRSGAIKGSTFFAHRIIWKMMMGADPECIDHINGDRGDNRFCNLREVTKAENTKNVGIQARNTSGCIGVRWIQKIRKWEVRMKEGHSLKYLAYFSDREEAIRARRSAERRHGYHPNHGVRPSAAKPRKTQTATTSAETGSSS